MQRRPTAGETIADLELLVIARFLKPNGSLLHLGCGGGRSSVYLNSKGFEAIGVEIDPPTISHAQQLNRENGMSCGFVRADGRSLCFRVECFGYVVFFGSTLSEKYRLWLGREDRRRMISEAIRVTRSEGVVIVNFVHRCWNFKHFLGFMKYYVSWAKRQRSGTTLKSSEVQWSDFTHSQLERRSGSFPKRVSDYLFGEKREVSFQIGSSLSPGKAPKISNLCKRTPALEFFGKL